jgi:hypothetical protein
LITASLVVEQQTSEKPGKARNQQSQNEILPM